jgi:hypothetical protein
VGWEQPPAPNHRVKCASSIPYYSESEGDGEKGIRMGKKRRGEDQRQSDSEFRYKCLQNGYLM